MMAISETKLNDNTSANLHIPGYLFVRTDSKSHAGGFGLYVSDQLVFSRRRDLDISRAGIPRKEKDGGCTFYHNALQTKLSPLGV